MSNRPAGDALEDLAVYLTTKQLGRVHEHHRSLGSTNDRALAWLREGAPHGALVTAEAQAAGRGRRGRTWFSPPSASLYVSVVLRPGQVPTGFGALGLAVAVGLREGLPPLREPVELKWPNDLLVGGRKLGGILCEARWTQGVPEVVVGFGINVHTSTFPEALAGVATSLMREHGPTPIEGRAVLLARLLQSLEQTLDTFWGGGFAAIRHRYEPHCNVLGRRVELGDAMHPEAARQGIAIRLDHDGALWVRPPAGGDAFRVETADVWLRPPDPSRL